MKKIIGVLLVALSLYLGYVGITKFSDSGKSVEIIGVEIGIENNQEKSTSYIYLGAALLSFIGGLVLIQAKKP